MTMTVKDTLLYYMIQYSLVDLDQSFEAMETIVGIERFSGRGNSSPYISTIFPLLGLILHLKMKSKSPSKCR
jgi:hypothetical protein